MDIPFMGNWGNDMIGAVIRLWKEFSRAENCLL